MYKFSDKKNRSPEQFSSKRAEDEVRTRDLQLGKLTLYQLSYFRRSHAVEGVLLIFGRQM
jgi:hypothetical protein